jgi:hypothetical protein
MSIKKQEEKERGWEWERENWCMVTVWLQFCIDFDGFSLV